MTSLAECVHRYGTRAKSKEVPGVVIEVTTAKTKNNRTNTYVLAEYSFGGGVTKQVKLNICSVLKEVSVPQDAVDDDRIVGPAPEVDINEMSTVVAESVLTENNSTVIVPARPVDTTPPVSIIATPTTVPGPSTPPGSPEPMPPPPPPDLRRSPRRRGPPPTVTVHDTDWFENQRDVQYSVGGLVMERDFAIRTPVGDTLSHGTERNGRQSRLDYFLLMFPPEELNLIVTLTNTQLTGDGKLTTSHGEIIKFLGIWILITRFEFSSHASLWSTTANSKYIPAGGLG